MPGIRYQSIFFVLEARYRCGHRRRRLPPTLLSSSPLCWHVECCRWVVRLLGFSPSSLLWFMRVMTRKRKYRLRRPLRVRVPAPSGWAGLNNLLAFFSLPPCRRASRNAASLSVVIFFCSPVRAAIPRTPPPPIYPHIYIAPSSNSTRPSDDCRRGDILLSRE